MASTKASPVSMKAAFGVMCITLVCFTAGATTPAMGMLFEQFADWPQWLVSLINTLPSLGTIIGILVFGSVANGKVKFKTIANIGMLSSGVFGILPAFWNDSIWVILLCRLICGFGTGFIMSLGATWFMRMIRVKDERGKYLSWNQMFGSGGGIIFTMLGGWLATIQWNYCFLSLAFIFVAWIIMLICFQEPKTVEQIVQEEGAKSAEEFQQAKRVKLGAGVWVVMLLFMGYQMLLSQGLILSSVFMDINGAGTAGDAANCLSIFTVFTAVFCAFGGAILKALGKFTDPIFYCILGVGMICLLVAGSNTMLYYVAMALLGIGACVCAFVNFEVSLITSPAGMAWAASLMMIGTNLGNFLSSFLLGALQGIGGDNVYFPVIFAAVGYFVLGAIFLIFNLTSKGWRNYRAEKLDGYVEEATPLE